MESEQQRFDWYRQYENGELTESELRKKLDLVDVSNEAWEEYYNSLGYATKVQSRIRDVDEKFF